MSFPPPAMIDEPVFKIRLDAKEANLSKDAHVCWLDLPSTLLGGRAVENIPLPGSTILHQGNLLMLDNPETILGAIVVDGEDRLEQSVRDAYAHLLDVCAERDMHLHRVWNYVPRINDSYQGLERYRQFNIGRWLAFEQYFGRDLRSFMPAASAVGVPGSSFALFFIAGKTQPIYLENPSQVPAYHYPSEYGPRPPGFARAVLVPMKDQTIGFLSGTASIEGHRTVGEGDWHLQFRTTMHNIEIMLDRMNMVEILRGPEAAAKAGVSILDLRCYLRHSEMLPLLKEWIKDEVGLSEDQVTFQQADICRSDLDLEIEAVFAKTHV